MHPTATELPLWHTLLLIGPIAAYLLAVGASARRDVATACRLAGLATGTALLLALAGAVALATSGGGTAWGLRSDAVGASATVLVGFVGWIIVRYSQTALAGAPAALGYMRALLLTLGSVLLVVNSNHLLLLSCAWTLSSLTLHQLLTYYPGRPAAQLAAHKKFIVARLADVCMWLACALLYQAFGSLRIDALLVLATAQTALSSGTVAAVLLVVLAAILKSAQLPFHGWLIQVMEAPTPVSALLHAGLVNLGGLVLIRLAPLVAEVPAAMALLVVVGGLTAVLAALVMTTRISIKVMLAWSTCAQMGFMLMQCGLGLWDMALLHLVGHSLYKAYAFLSAGETVRQTMVRALAPARLPAGPGPQLAAAATSLGLTGAVAAAWVAWTDAPPALAAMAVVLALAWVPMLLGSGAPRSWQDRLLPAVASVALTGVYLALHTVLQPWVAPTAAVPQTALWVPVMVAFTGLFLLQWQLTRQPAGAIARRLYPWVYGGMFLDQTWSRWALRLWPAPRPRATATPSPSVPAP
jgi:NAD(P)H-quinone oxidoreductase subunit 5